MQRILFALLALVALPGVNLSPAYAQEHRQAVEPTHTPQEVDEPVAPSAPEAETPAPAHRSAPPMEQRFDAAPSIVVIGGSSTPSHVVQHRERHSWAGGQFGLLVLGLLGGLILQFAAPRAANRTADRLAAEPRRCLVVGALTSFLLLAILGVNLLLLHIPLLGLLWSPFGLLIATLPPLLLGCGWLAGMRCTGDVVARKFGNSQTGSLYGRIVLGLFSFFLLNALCGSMSRGLGVLGLGVEFLVALMGLGALVMTGRGTQPNRGAGWSGRWRG